jgi:hypothetical protein
MRVFRQHWCVGTAAVAFLSVSAAAKETTDTNERLEAQVATRNAEEIDLQRAAVGAETVRRFILALHQDYDSWTEPEDFAKLHVEQSRFIRGRSAIGLPLDLLIPLAIKTKFGSNAQAEFIKNVLLGSANRAPGKMADSLLRSLFSKNFSLSLEESNRLEMDVPIRLGLADGTVKTVSSAEAVTYLMGQGVVQNRETTASITIGFDLLSQIAKANAQVLKNRPWMWGSQTFDINDGAAYDVGFAIASGYGSNIGPFTTTEIPRDKACAALPAMEGRIFNPTIPDRPMIEAFMAGFARAKVGDC